MLGKPGFSPPRSLPKSLCGTVQMNCGHRRMNLAGSLGRPIAVDTGFEKFFTEPLAQEDARSFQFRRLAARGRINGARSNACLKIGFSNFFILQQGY